MMKLYYARGACSLAVRIIINELGLKCHFEAVNLKEKKTESGKDYLEINPKGAVPALEIKPGEVLTENAVILQYLADTNHADNLLPPQNDFKRYRTLEWINYITTELHKGFAPLFNPNIPQELKDSLFIPPLKVKFAYLNKQLNDHPYLLGEHFSLSDAYLFVILRWSVHFKFNLATWPELEKYYQQLQLRDAIAQSLKQENL